MNLSRSGLAFRKFATTAASILLAVALSACAGEGHDGASIEERMLVQEAKAHLLEESLEAVRDENAALRGELAGLQEENAALGSELSSLRQEQADYIRAREAAAAAREHEAEAAESEEGQRGQLAALEERQAQTEQRLDDLNSRVDELEEVASQVELALPAMKRWFTGMDERMKLLEGTGINRTLRLAAEGSGQAQVINYGAEYGGARSAVLVLPDKLPEGGIPLIVSLHGFGSDSFLHSRYIPLHHRVNRGEFALLLPDGIENAEGQRFWNPTDGPGKADQDDVGALSALVQEASEEFDAGPVYIFGHSNGGFMAYHMACEGLPGLRAVASLAGTSYMDDSACEGAPRCPCCTSTEPPTT